MWIFSQWKRLLYGLAGGLICVILTWWLILGFEAALPTMIEYLGLE